MGVEALLWVGLYLLCGFVTAWVTWRWIPDSIGCDAFLGSVWGWLFYGICWPLFGILTVFDADLWESYHFVIPPYAEVVKRRRERAEKEALASEVVPLETRVAEKGNAGEAESF